MLFQSTVNSLKRDLSSRDRLGLITSTFLGNFCLAIYGSYVGVYLEQLGTAVLVIGIILAARNAFQIILRVPLGELSQIVGRKPLMMGGLLSYSAAFYLMTFAWNWMLVFLATALVALGMSCFWPAMFSAIGDVANDNYGRFNGRIFQGGDVGVIIGSFFAAFSLKSLQWPLNQLFLVSGLISTILILLLTVFVPEVLQPEHQKRVESVIYALWSSFRSMLSSFLKMTTRRELYRVYSFQLLISFMEYMLTSFFPLLIVIAKGYPLEVVAELALYSTIVLFFFKPYLGGMSDRFGYRVTVTGALLLTSTSFFVMVITNDLIILWVSHVFAQAGLMTSYLAVNGGTSRVVPSNERGLALGVLGVHVSLGRSLSSLMLSPLWELFDLDAVFLGCILIALVSLVLLNWTEIRERRRQLSSRFQLSE